MEAKKQQGPGGISSVKRELLASLLAEEGVELSQSIPRRESSQTAPLSFAQQRLWFLHQMEPDSPAYNLPAAVRLEGRLDLRALEQSLNEIVRRHESLRTTFAQSGDEPTQVISPASALTISVKSLEDLPASEREPEVLRLTREEALAPFDLFEGPLLRASLLRLGAEEHILLFTLHHIVSDAWSTGVLVREFVQLYEAFSLGRKSPLAELSIQYADFAAWQRGWLKGELLEKQLAYWERQLAGSETLTLPTDRPRPAAQSFRGANQPVAISKGATEALNRLSREEGCTLFMTLLAAFNVLLGRHAGQDDISVGTPIAGRKQVETEGLIGFFINTLVMRTDLAGDPTFRELMGRVRRVSLDAYGHQDVPFETLVERLQPERGLGHSPLFQVALALQTAPAEMLKIPGLKLNPVGGGLGTAKFELTLDLRESPEGLSGVIEYSTDLFDAETVARMAAQLETLLEGIAADPDRAVSALPLLTPDESLRLVAEWNSTVREYAKEQSLHELFERQAKTTPDAVAIIYGERQLTYRELNESANRLAHRLQREGVGPDVLVGVLMERSIELVVGLLGILKAGGAYVPLDVSYPQQRLSFMLEDARISLLLTEARHAVELQPGVRAIYLDAESKEFEGEQASNPAVRVSPEHLAYVSYTSGSTGQPKGTAVPHRSVMGFMLDVDYVRYDSSVRFLQYSSISWDALTLELWPALVHGGSCVLYQGWLPTPAEIGQAVKRHGVNTLWITSSLFNAILDSTPEALEGVTQVMTGGEALSEAHVRRALELLPRTRLVNGYGPSECVVFTCCQPLGNSLGVAGRGVPIGKAIGDRRVYLLDKWMSPVPVGLVGELYVGGDGVSRGYLNRPQLTAEKFVPDPFSARPGARLYRTGDLVRFTAEGRMEFAGRADDQVKVRGFRIELGEIESALARHASVRECVVLVRQEQSEKQLTAYAVTRPGPEVDASTLRAHLKQQMPEYMIPSGFVLLTEMPLTPHGKVDRKALLALRPTEGMSDAASVAPRTAVEEVVAGVWAEVLRVERVGVRENFFELGGHSLLATQVVARLRKVFGVELPLRRMFEEPTVEATSRAIEESMGLGLAAEAPPIERAARDRELPLSFAQQRLWFLDRLQPGTTAYNLPAAVRVGGKLDVSVLGRALGEVVRRHEVLRTVFRQVDGRAVQVVREAAGVDLPLLDLSGLEEAERDAKVWRLAEEEARLPFDLAEGPLLRARVLKLKEDEHVLLLAQHHIISDGWSMGVLVRELTTLYRAFADGKESPLAELSIQYADFAAWQRGWLKGEVLESGMEYWRGQLGGELPVLDLPTDHPRPSAYSYSGGRFHLELPAPLTGALKALGREQGATLFMTLLAGFKALLQRYTNQDDILVGTPVAGRNRAETEGLIGFFVNTLVLRTRLDGGQSFQDLIAAVRESALGAYAHQDIPFEKLVEELHPERDTSHSPLFQAMFVLQNNPLALVELPGLSLSPFAVPSDFSNFDLTLVAEESAQGATSADFCYNSDLFDAETIARMAANFITLLEAAVADPRQQLSRLPLLTAAERGQMLSVWSSAERTELPPLCAHQLFEVQAAKRPGATAVSFGDEQVSYRELNARANRLAHYLRRLGVGPEARVGISVGRSVEMVVAVLAVLKAGGAYVPLDTTYPTERLAFMLEDAEVLAVVVDSEAAEKLPPHGAQTVSLDDLREELAHESNENPESGVGPDNLAYMIYTSGSTGRPKGTLIEHHGVCNLAEAQARFFDVRAYGRVLQFASLSFDASASEIFVTLGAGATLCLAKQEDLMPGAPLRALLREQEITAVTLPPVALAVMSSDDLPDLETVVTAGDACPPQVAARWARGRRFVNAYGPTEVSVCATMADCTEAAGKPPIGRPITNARVYLLDAHLEPVPVGVGGELYVSGVGLARGYHRRPDLTAEKFLPDLFSAEPGARMYRTGDLARFLHDGQIEFLGRADRQVKVRGFRVEPGEIESALGRLTGVREAAVLARDEASGSKRLVAYFVAEPGSFITSAELRRALRESQPEYMIPSAFMQLEEMPLTPSGKIDRKALPEPGRDLADAEDAYVAPRTPVEEVLAGILAETVGVERVGVNDNFFDLGGHSLIATQAVSRAGDAFGVEVPLRWLFERPTVAGLGERVEEAIRAGHGVESPPIQPVSRAQELPLSFAQQRLWFIDQLEPGSAAFNISKALRLDGALDARALELALTALTERHEVLRTTFRVVEGRAVQSVAEPTPVALPLIDLAGLRRAEQTEQTRRLATEEQQRPFDLSTGPLMRARLLRLGEEAHVLLVTMHHIIADGWSMDILSRETSALYDAFSRGAAPQLAELPVQYADFAAWQRNWLQGDALEVQLSYWRQQLGGDPPVLRLPADRPRTSETNTAGSRQMVVLPDELTAPLRSLSRRNGATLFMTMLAAFDILLQRYTGQEDILVGTPAAGRNRAETESLIGFFVNTLVLRADLSGGPTFAELLGRVRESALGAYAHQDIPFEKLVEELHPERKVGSNPFFDVLVNYAGVSHTASNPQGGPSGLTTGLTIGDLDLAEADTHLPLMLIIGDRGSEVVLQLIYQKALFTPARIASMLEQFTHLLEQVIESPDAPIASYSLRAAEGDDFLPDPTLALPAPPQPFVTEMIFGRVVENPNSPAVSQSGREWTYEELADSARVLAQGLVADGLVPGDVVAVTGPRSFGLIASMLAAFASRGVLLTLDPALPVERRRVMLRESKAKYLLHVGRVRPEDAWLREEEALLCRDVDPLTGSADAQEATDVNAAELSPLSQDDPAYIFFTSGTTGVPKGVLGRHKSLGHFIAWQRETFGVGPSDRAAQLTGLSFDVVLRDIFTPLAGGATLCLPEELESTGPEQVLAWLEQERVTLMHSVPSLAQFWLANRPEGVTLRTLRCLFFAGEPLTDTLVRRWREAFPESGAIINLYGPTETTLAKFYGRVPAEPAPGVQPVSHALPQTQGLVLREGDRLCGVGEVGEIVVRTPFRSLGYVNAGDEDRGRFFKNPFRDDADDLLYRTGDRGRYRSDGALEILGRVDQQVKIRGIRIEPGEVESALRRHEGVRDAVVIAREETSGEKYLAAYVVPEEKRQRVVAGKKRYELPNGMAVAQLSKHESDYLYREVFQLQAYTRHGITINDGDIIMDVGANIGFFTLFAQQLAKNTQVYSFEPTPPTFEVLKTNISLYGSGVKVFNFGISDEERKAEFSFFPGFSFLTGRYADPEIEREVVKSYVVSQRREEDDDLRAIEAEADEILEDRFRVETFTATLKTLSSVIEQEGIERIDLLKINVEKSELDVIKGISDEDWLKVRQIAMEVDVAENLTGILRLLDEKGFDYVVEQDVWLTDTPLCYVYAVPRSASASLIREQERGAHFRELPTFDAPYLTAGELKRFAAGQLPQAMIPSAFVFLDELPLTANGKVDRRALPDPEREGSEREGGYAAPRTPAEEVLAGIWADVLGLERVSVYDNFFELGGHSLLVTKAVFRVRTAFNVELPVRKVFEQPTVAGLARTIESLTQEGDGAVQLPSIEPAPRDRELPTSSGQELALAVAEREGRPSFYGRLLTLSGPLDVSALERALNQVISRHESLRTTFEQVDGSNVQIFHSARPISLTPIDLSGLTGDEQEEATLALSNELMQTPFDLSTGPLFRVILVRLNDSEHLLLYAILHIICDPWSLDILNREVSALYEAFSHGKPSLLEQLPIQYGDFAYWERNWLSGGARDEELSFWKRQLEGALTFLPLPTDHPRMEVQTFKGGSLRTQLPVELQQSLKALCRRESVTLYMASLAAFGVLLKGYTGREDILVGTGVGGRTRPEVENVIGQFVNLLAMRTRLDGDPTFRELLARVRETTLKSFAHQGMPFWELVKEFAADAHPSCPPLVQVGFVAHHEEGEAIEPSGDTVSSIYTIETNRAAFDVLVSLDDTPAGLFATFNYNTDLFEEATAQRMLGHFRELLVAAVEDPARRISEMPTPAEDTIGELVV